jgi:hypothetical protein
MADTKEFTCIECKTTVSIPARRAFPSSSLATYTPPADWESRGTGPQEEWICRGCFAKNGGWPR